MDAVNAFNHELFSLMDSKPPISRAKMISITKSAIKAMKVRLICIVTKLFLHYISCKPEYKVAGLYVVDSIVRQSRHQFGADKDVFGPRFTKNITGTFENLCLCPVEDRSKIVRVLNLWQKNCVFKIEVIQPLLDMAAANTSAAAVPFSEADESEEMPNSTLTTAAQLQTSDAFAAVAQLFQTTQGQQLQQMLQNFQQKPLKQEANVQPTQPQGQSITMNLGPVPPQPPPPSQPAQSTAFAKTLLDRFDYDDEPDGSLPLNGQPQAFGQVFPLGGIIPPPGHPQMGQPPLGASGPTDILICNVFYHYFEKTVSFFISRSPKRRRSRSNSRSRRSRHRRSRSRERRHHSPRARSQERKERERERERRQKGLPPLKSHTLSICTTTLWVGQLDKRTQQQDVECLLEEFGQIESTNMIPPRGCAYIVMVHRQDAFRALQKLSRGNYKVNQKTIKIAWALNKGIKTDFKQYWDVDHGVTYIPWSKIKEEDLDELKDGGILDIDSLAPEITHNGRTESQPEEVQVVPIAPSQPAVVAVGPVQPPVFPGPMGVPLPSFPAGVPPPFLRPGFNPLHMPPGAPPGSLPGGPPGGPSLEGQHVGPPSGSLLSSLPGGPRPATPGNLHPSGGLLGARPGLIPLQRPPGLSPNMQRFPPSQGPRPPHSGASTMDRAPHPQMHPDSSPGFPPHNARGPFPSQGHGPPSFNRPGGGPRGEPHRGMESPEEMEGRQFRGERAGFRDRDSERDWDRDRERDRGFGGGRRFGEGARIDGRDRPSGWQDDGNPRGGWERDRGRDQDRDRERDRDRRDWRERRSSPDRDRGRDTGERRDSGERRDTGERRDRGRGERGSRSSRDSRDSRDGDRGRSGENKEGDRPRRSERRERSTRWDNDDRLNELENSERSRTTDRETSSDRSHRKTNSEPLASKGDDSKTEPSNKSNTSEEKQETTS
uniref:Uncharacterized protein n=1 Tax=Periophthalmus magnuspinnatus TaxID=409849 RepID=A0A3B4AU08_9GOBI